MKKIPLILLPGTLCDNTMWEFQLNKLKRIADCKIISLQQDSIEKMAKDVLEQAPDRFALAGFSMGGNVAIEVVKQAPKRVLKLALLDINPNPPRPEQIEGWKTFIGMAREGEFASITPHYLLPNMVSPNAEDQISSTIIKMAEHIGKDTMIKQMTALINRPDGRKTLQGVECPTLLLTGEEDVLCTTDTHKEMNKHLSHSELVIIKNSGHMTTLEQPEAVYSALHNWLLNK
ncbi:alpha/beta fold hydrolase [Priestia megaterium]|uniref:alpha/beta fold hydrolase n=1 Tax=Priestia megaterium TaxID=1404 RepID=UPI0036722154